MNRRFMVAILFAAALAFAANAQMGAKSYASGETRGQVVDAESSAPIEGVVIVARWEWDEWHFSHGGGNYYSGGQTVHTGEVVTDAGGRFNLAKWGPTIKSSGRMEDDMPRLLAFKAGYEPLSQGAKDGTTLRLKKFTGEPRAYAQLIEKFQAGRGGLSWSSDENWSAIPKMVMALHREHQRLGADGDAILGANRMPNRSGEVIVLDSATRLPPNERVVLWVEWTLRRGDGAPGTRRVVQTMSSQSYATRSLIVSPWIVPGPMVAGWEIDPSVTPTLRVYVNGYQHSADVRWDEKGGTISVSKLDSSRETVVADLRARRKDIDAQLARGDRAEALALQETMLSAFQFQCRTLTPDLQAELCFDVKSDAARQATEAGRRGIVAQERSPIMQAVAVSRAGPPATKAVTGFTIELANP